PASTGRTPSPSAASSSTSHGRAPPSCARRTTRSSSSSPTTSSLSIPIRKRTSNSLLLGRFRAGFPAPALDALVVQVAELVDLPGVDAVPVGARHLEHRREALEGLVREEDAELVPDEALADVRVAVAVRAEPRQRVVHVQHAEPVEPDPVVDLLDEPIELVPVGHVVAGHPEVAGVEADAEPRVRAEPVDDDRELVDRAPDRPAGAGGVLEAEPGVP